MNVEAVQQKLSAKLGESKAFQLMNDFNNLAELYPAAYIFLPEPTTEKEAIKVKKREKLIAKLSAKLYPAHTLFNKPLNEYSNSVILIGSDMAVPYMLAEVADFVIHLEQFYKEVKQANSVQEMQPHYKQFTLKGKDLTDAMLEDLEMYADRYGFASDRKAWMTVYKEVKIKSNKAIKGNYATNTN